MSAKVLDGRVVIYGSPHWYEGRQDIFEAGCFKGSLDLVWFGIEHRYLEKPLGCQEDGLLELHDDDVALSFRLKLGPGALERLDGRSEASAAYSVREYEIRGRCPIYKVGYLDGNKCVPCGQLASIPLHRAQCQQRGNTQPRCKARLRQRRRGFEVFGGAQPTQRLAQYYIFFRK